MFQIYIFKCTMCRSLDHSFAIRPSTRTCTRRAMSRATREKTAATTSSISPGVFRRRAPIRCVQLGYRGIGIPCGGCSAVLRGAVHVLLFRFCFWLILLRPTVVLVFCLGCSFRHIFPFLFYWYTTASTRAQYQGVCDLPNSVGLQNICHGKYWYGVCDLPNYVGLQNMYHYETDELPNPRPTQPRKN